MISVQSVGHFCAVDRVLGKSKNALLPSPEFKMMSDECERCSDS